MRSVIQKQSYNSVQVFWLDREAVRLNIEEAVGKLTREHPEVGKVVLFGSVAEGRSMPGSDADILLVVSSCTSGPLDRGDKYRHCFGGVGLGVDLFVYTRDEIETGNIPLAVTAMKQGIVLFER